METWEIEVQQAVIAGEWEFGPLDGHQTLEHNLVRRCLELLAESSEPEPVKRRATASADGDAQ